MRSWKFRTAWSRAVLVLRQQGRRLGQGRWSRAVREGWRRSRGRVAQSRQALARATQERDVWFLYVEVFWAALFMATMSFNATYALRLGASNTLMGWLSSVPALLAMLVLYPAARFLETKSNRAPWLNGSLFIGRLMFAGVALVPWLLERGQAEAVVWVLILRAIPMNIFSAGFTPMLADVVPPRDRARVFSNRNIINSAVLAVSTYLLGLWLDAAAGWSWGQFPLNYQMMYLVGAVAAMLSVYYVSRVRVPPTKVIERAPRAPGDSEEPFLERMRESLRLMTSENRDFVRIVVNTLLFNFGAWLVMPLYIIFFVKELNASDSWVGLNTTLANLGVIAGQVLWRRFITRYGDNRALLLSLPLSALYAFLVAFFPNLTLILIWGILINLINPGVNLSHFNILIQLCPEERRASFMAIFSTVMNLGAFVGPMIGVALSGIMAIRWVLLIGGVLRLLGAFMFYIWKVDVPDTALGREPQVT